MSEADVVWWCSVSFFKSVFLQTPLNTIVRAVLSTEFSFAPTEICNCFLNPYTRVNIPTLLIYVT